jgi:mannosyltransferase
MNTFAFSKTNRINFARQPEISNKVFLGGLMLLAMALGIAVLFSQSLRLDEAQSLWQTSHSLSGMLKVVASDVHVPLYHIVLHFWEMFFSNDVAAARSLSLIFFVLTIPAVYFLAELAFDQSIARFSALLVALSPFLNWYGSEIRMYSMFTFIMVLNQYFFLKLFKEGKSNRGVWVGYTITAILGSFTHYFFLLGLLAQAVFFLFNMKRFRGGSLARLVVVAGLVTVVLGGWLFYVNHVGAIGNSKPHLIAPTSINLFNTFSQFVFGFQDDHLNTLILSLWPFSVLLAFMTLNKAGKINANTSYFFLAAFLPIIVAFVISITIQPLFLTRYLILTIPSFYIFLSWLFSIYPPRVGQVFRIVLIACMIVTFVNQAAAADTPVKENFREVSEYLNQNVQAQDVVVVSAPFTIYPIEYYYRGPASITTLPIWNRYQQGAIPAFSDDNLPKEVEEIKGDHRKAWVVLSYDQGYEEKIRIYLDTHLERVDKKEFSPGLALYVYKLRYDSLGSVLQ